MQIELELILNETKSKIFVTTIGTKCFRNPKNSSHEVQIKGSIKNRKKIRINIEDAF